MIAFLPMVFKEVLLVAVPEIADSRPTPIIRENNRVVRVGSGRFGEFGPVRSGPVRLGSVRYGSGRFGGFGPVRFGSDRIGSARVGSGRFGSAQVSSVSVPFGSPSPTRIFRR